MVQRLLFEGTAASHGTVSVVCCSCESDAFDRTESELQAAGWKEFIPLPQEELWVYTDLIGLCPDCSREQRERQARARRRNK